MVLRWLTNLTPQMRCWDDADQGKFKQKFLLVAPKGERIMPFAFGTYLSMVCFSLQDAPSCLLMATVKPESSRERYGILSILGLCLPAALRIYERAQEAIYTFNVRSHIATPFSGTTCHKLSNITPQTWCRDEILHHKRDVEATDNSCPILTRCSCEKCLHQEHLLIWEQEA